LKPPSCRPRSRVHNTNSAGVSARRNDRARLARFCSLPRKAAILLPDRLAPHPGPLPASGARGRHSVGTGMPLSARKAPVLSRSSRIETCWRTYPEREEERLAGRDLLQYRRAQVAPLSCRANQRVAQACSPCRLRHGRSSAIDAVPCHRYASVLGCLFRWQRGIPTDSEKPSTRHFSRGLGDEPEERGTSGWMSLARYNPASSETI
jgi:hypothetical protein